ncbi:hypothetical protein PIB30_092376, partial [Stylosanthes scabra]|nr:hypothetical protein [Stylosanthes scabra]
KNIFIPKMGMPCFYSHSTHHQVAGLTREMDFLSTSPEPWAECPPAMPAPISPLPGKVGAWKSCPPYRRRQGRNGPCKKACVYFAGASGKLAMSLVARASWQDTRPTSVVPHVACIGH